MKKKLLIFSILLSTFCVVNVYQANANCTSTDPCGTWAVVDTQGVVTNVIVCQASVCGSGTFGGETVVPQVAPNPTTNDPYGTGSYIGNSENNTIVTYENGRFFIDENKTIIKNDIEIFQNKTTVSSVEIPVSLSSFTYEDTINKLWGQVDMQIEAFNETKPTTLTVTESIDNNIILESKKIYERKTTSEIETLFVDNNLNLLLSKINTLISLLGTWVK